MSEIDVDGGVTTTERRRTAERNQSIMVGLIIKAGNGYVDKDDAENIAAELYAAGFRQEPNDEGRLKAIEQRLDQIDGWMRAVVTPTDD